MSGKYRSHTRLLPVLFLILCTLWLVPAFAERALTLPSHLSLIGPEAFTGNTSLEKVIIPDGATSIGPRAFAGCRSLWCVVIPDSVSSIADDAFDGCPLLSIRSSEHAYACSYALSRGIPYMNSDGQLSGTDASGLRYSLSDGVLTLSGSAGMATKSSAAGYPWYHVRDLIRKIVAEDGVETIAARAFEGCSALQEAVLPDSLYYIGRSAFSGVPDTFTVSGRSGSYAQEWTEAQHHIFQKKLEIISSPDVVRFFDLEEVSFHVDALGDGLTYFWERSPRGSDKFYTIYGAYPSVDPLALTDTYTDTMDYDMDGWRYRCTVTDERGNTLTTQPAVLSLRKTAKITKHPGTVRVRAGDPATFSIEAEGDGLEYFWQYRLSTSYSEEDWRDVVGAHSPSLTILVENSNKIYRCLIKDTYGNTARSMYGRIRLDISMSDPEDLSVDAGGTAAFDVTVSGEDLTLLWQVCYAGETVWRDLGASYGSNTRRISFTATAYMDGNRYRCVCKDASDAVQTSRAALLSVNVPVTGVTMQSAMSMETGSIAQLAATVEPYLASDRRVTWKSSRPDVVDVTGNGILTAGSHEGTAVVTVATLDGGFIASCTVTVFDNLKLAAITPSVTRIECGESLSYTVDITGGVRPFTVTSSLMRLGSSSPVLTRTLSGSSDRFTDAFTINQPGIYYLSCKVADSDLVGASGTSDYVTVIRRATSLRLSDSTLFLTVNEHARLTATVLPSDASDQGVSWNVLNPEVATCTDGIVVARGGGQTIVSATSEDGGFTLHCTVFVSVPVQGVSLSETSLKLTAGQVCTLKAEILPANASNPALVWSSSDPSVVTVENGEVRATGKGTAKITVTTQDGGFQASCTATVTEAVSGILLSREKLVIETGSSSTIVATVLPDGADANGVTWSSSDTGVARVGAGYVSAVHAGTAVITATSPDGAYTAQCQVTVYDPLAIGDITARESTVNVFSGGCGYDFSISGGVAPYTSRYELVCRDNGKVTGSASLTDSWDTDCHVNIEFSEPGTFFLVAEVTDAEGHSVKKTSPDITVLSGVAISSVTLSSTSVQAGETVSASVSVSGGQSPYTVTMELFRGNEVTDSRSFQGTGTSYTWSGICPTASGTYFVRATVMDATEQTSFKDSPSLTVGTVLSTRIVPSVTELHLLTGTSANFSVTIEPSNVSNRSVNISVTDTSVIRFDQTAMTVAALKAGTAQIIIASADGASRAVIPVTVEDPVPMSNTELGISERGIQFIRDHEGLSKTVYDDGTGVYTIGYGHTYGVTASTPPISDEQAEAYLMEDIASKIGRVDDFLKKNNMSLLQHQYDALVSLVFNLATNPLGGDYRLTRLLTAYKNSPGTIPAEKVWECFATWHNYKNKKDESIDMYGLYNRRMDEARLFISGDYSMKTDWKKPSWLKPEQVGDDVPEGWIPDEAGGQENNDPVPQTAFAFNKGLLSLSDTSYAYCYALSKGSIDVYTSKELTTKGTVDTGAGNSHYIDGAHDELWLLGVGVSGNWHWAKVSYPISGTSQRHTAYIPLDEIVYGRILTSEVASGTCYVCDRRDAQINDDHYVSPGDTVHTLAYSDGCRQILYPVSGGKYRIAWQRNDEDVHGNYNSGLDLLSASRPAYAFAPGNTTVVTYTDKNLSSRGNEEKGAYSTAGITPQTDDLQIFDVGTTNGRTWAYLTYPVGNIRYHAYVYLSDLIPGTSNEHHKSTITYAVSDRPGEGTNPNHYVEPGDDVYLLTRNGDGCQIMYTLASGSYRIAWCTTDEYNNQKKEPDPPTGLIFSFAAASDSYTAFGKNGMSYAYSALKDHADRQDALNAMLKEKGYTASSLSQIRKLIVFLDGYGYKVSDGSKRTALCVVFSYGKVIFASDQASTLPDRPFDSKGNHTTSDSRSTDIGTLVDGTYTAENTYHKKSYPALNVKGAYAVRIHVGSTSSSEHDMGSKNNNGSCKCPTLFGHQEMSLVHTGINIHRSTIATIRSEGSIPDSAGCINVYTDDYARFAAAAGFATITNSSGVPTASVSSASGGKSCSVTVIVSRKYGYEHSTAFRNFVRSKYTAGGTCHESAINAILSGSKTYTK